MHEFSFIQSVFSAIDDVAKKNKLRKVTKVTLKIGGLRQLVPDFLEFAFENIADGTIYEKAKLKIIEVPIKVKCDSCKKEFTVKKQIYICPECNSTKLEILSGKEATIESIEGETEE